MGGARRPRQSGGWVISRLPDQQRFIAHPRGQAGAEDNGAGVNRCAGGHRVADGATPDLPQPADQGTSGAVVIASAIGLIEVTDLRRIHRIQQWEFWLSIVSARSGVAVFGAIEGIGLAIVIAVIEFLWDAWRPYSAILGRAQGVQGFHDIKRYPGARMLSAGVVSLGHLIVFRQRVTVQRPRVLDPYVARIPDARALAGRGGRGR